MGDMMTVRPAAVAGMFYPGSRAELEVTVRGLLEAAGPVNEPAPKALIVPHAGYVYSGAIAARGFATLAAGSATIRRVVLLGPTHRVAVAGIALPGCDAFQTPLGTIPVDAELVAVASRLPGVVTRPDVHVQEHSLEVQLPFLQTVLDDFTLLPLAVGSVPAAVVGDVLAAVWGGPETVIVVSSDLSHYHRYDQARAIDADTVATRLALDEPLDHEQACGATPINGLVAALQQHPLRPRLVAMCNSGDSAGDHSRVVGYASLRLDEEA